MRYGLRDREPHIGSRNAEATLDETECITIANVMITF